MVFFTVLINFSENINCLNALLKSEHKGLNPQKHEKIGGKVYVWPVLLISQGSRGHRSFRIKKFQVILCTLDGNNHIHKDVSYYT